MSGIADKEALASQTRHQSSKMDALGELAGGIAHDFNNLLQVLSGQLEMLKMRVGDPSLVAMVDRGLGSVLRGEKLVEHLMAFARRQPLKREVIDLRSTLRDITDTLTRALRGFTVEGRIADDLWAVLADRSLLESAILNMAFNARDAMSGSGTLTLSAWNIPSGTNGGDHVGIMLTDTGSGMASEVLTHAFEPFFTTKEPGTGTGLGLSMVHDFAQQSGGSATIESEVGKGTSITIHLPRAERLALAPTSSCALARRALFGRGFFAWSAISS